MVALTDSIIDITGQTVGDIHTAFVRAPSQRPSFTGAGLVSTKPVAISDTGVLSLDLEPGPAVLVVLGSTFHDTWELYVEEGQATIRDAVAAVAGALTQHEVSVLRQLLVGAQAAAGIAADEREAAELAAQSASGDRSHVDQVRDLLDDVFDQSQAGQALPPRLMESALSATYVSLNALGVIQATDHGIVADGATDNAVALNTLMADVSAAGGGHIVLPAGDIRHVGWLIPHSNVRLSGAGQDVTVFLPEEYGFYAEATALDPLTNFHMSHLTIDGRNRTGQKTWKGYHGQYHYRCTWQNMTVRNTGMTGLGPDMLRDCLIFNVTTENTGLNNNGTQPSGNGIGIGAGAYPGWESFSIIGCTVKNAKRYGIMVEGGLIRTAAKIIGNTASECHSGGFGIGAGTGTIVTGNTAQSNLGNGFEFSNLTLASARMSGECIVSGNVAQDNGGDGITYDASVQRPSEGFPQIVNNMCTGNGGHGLRVALNLTLAYPQSVVTGFKIDGNTCSLNGAGGITFTSTGSVTNIPVAWTIDNNTLHRNGALGDRYGIRIGIPLQGSSIRNNMFYFSGLGESGVAVGHGAAAVTLTACRIEGNTSANPAAKVLNVASTATLDSSCVVQGNFPDDGSPSPKVLTANATLTAVDRVVVADGASSIYILKPNEVRAGRELVVKNVNATSATLRFSSGGGTIDGTATRVLAQWESVTLVSDGVTRWLAV